MPRRAPPDDCPGNPVSVVLLAGERLWRVHGLGNVPTEFNPTARPGPRPGEPVLGGRFDSTDGGYAYWYGASSEGGAFAESFARQLDYTKAGPRPLPYRLVTDRGISVVRTARELHLVVVHGAGAQQLGHDTWLTTCDEDNYPITREWAQAVRRWEPDADGLIWKSRRDPVEDALVLWGAPVDAKTGCGLVLFDPRRDQSEPLASGPARLRLDTWLTHWRLYIEPRAQGTRSP